MYSRSLARQKYGGWFVLTTTIAELVFEKTVKSILGFLMHFGNRVVIHHANLPDIVCIVYFRAWLALQEKEVPFKYTQITLGVDKPDWYIKLNPEGVVPTLQLGDRVVRESVCHLQHTQEKKFASITLKSIGNSVRISLTNFASRFLVIF